MNIYQEIWDCDLKNAGIIPLVKNVSDNKKDKEIGYIVIDLNPKPKHINGLDKNEVTIFKNQYIPEIENNKNPNSYKLFEKLLDNYILNQSTPEKSTPEKIKEVDELLNYVINSDSMKLAKEYLNKKLDNSCTEDEWKELLQNIWFKNYDNKNARSGFEHVFIGEQGNGKTLGGHHFWYNYLLHDGPYDKYHIKDTIYFLKYVQVQRSEVSDLAEVITISYKYIAKDSKNPQGIELNKKIGGFFVGPSVEGLMAIKTVAIIESVVNKSQDIETTINNETYNLKTILVEDNNSNSDNLLEHLNNIHLKTCYPIIQD
ncbi:MAG: hypothetical protein ACRDA5_09425 [Clostridium sp.]